MVRLSYDGIQKQIAKLQAQAKALEASQSVKKVRAVERVRALMKKLGVDLADLQSEPAVRRSRGAKPKSAAEPAKAARKSPRAGASVAPKFRDPESGVTWSGRGRTPVWLAAYLEQGRKREEFAIAAPSAGTDA